MEGPVTWTVLLSLINLAIQSATLLFVISHSLRLTSYLSTREYRDAVARADRDH